MKHLLFSLIFLLLLSGTNSFAQKESVAVDTNYILTLIDSCKTINDEGGDPKSAILVGQNALALIELAIPNADPVTQRSLKRAKATGLRIIGNVNKRISALSAALDHYKQSLAVAREADDLKNIGGSLLNMGAVYGDILEYEKALKCLFESVEVFEKMGSKYGMALAFSNLGVVYRSMKQDSLALEFYDQSINMYDDLEDKNGAAYQIIFMADIYKERGDIDQALEDYKFSLQMFDETADSAGKAYSIGGMGDIYQRKGDFKKAESHYLHALRIADLTLTKDILMALRDLYHEQGRDKEAYEMYSRFELIKDSIVTQSNTIRITTTEMQTDFNEKQAQLKAEKERDAAIAAEKSRQQKTVIISVVAGLILVVVFSVFVFNRWRLTQKQKNIIEVQKGQVEHQKKLVEEHQKEIVDSITYAKRLQEAILPPLDFVSRHLPESFVLYKPKDIVAGDFYWMEVLDNTIYMAAADCTGHGVPGAMVSIVCSNALNRTVKEFGFRETGKILDKVTDLVLETFEKSSTDVMDGMDISLLAIDKKAGRVFWSGANNALWYIQNNELVEVKANKQPIGKFDNRVPFTTNEINAAGGTTFFLYTDGYADQFGGPKGKKFRYKQLEEVLLKHNSETMSAQKITLERTIEEWRGENEQVDDILVIGIRI